MSFNFSYLVRVLHSSPAKYAQSVLWLIVNYGLWLWLGFRLMVHRKFWSSQKLCFTACLLIPDILYGYVRDFMLNMRQISMGSTQTCLSIVQCPIKLSPFLTSNDAIKHFVNLVVLFKKKLLNFLYLLRFRSSIRPKLRKSGGIRRKN